MRRLKWILLIGLGILTGCASVYPQTSESFVASVYQRIEVPGVSVKETSGTLAMKHAGPLNSDSRTSGSLGIGSDGSVHVDGGAARPFTSAVTAWDLLTHAFTTGLGIIVGKGL